MSDLLTSEAEGLFVVLRQSVDPETVTAIESFVAESTDRDQFRFAQHQSHLPARAPHHGANSEHLVSSDRPQSAEIYEYSGRQTRGFSEGNRKGVSRRRARVGDCAAGDSLNAFRRFATLNATKAAKGCSLFVAG